MVFHMDPVTVIQIPHAQYNLPISTSFRKTNLCSTVILLLQWNLVSYMISCHHFFGEDIFNSLKKLFYFDKRNLMAEKLRWEIEKHG